MATQDGCGLLIEPKLRWAFIANEDSDSMIVLDLRSAKRVAQFKASGKPDVLSYDDKLGLLYLAMESGHVHSHP